jgi:hypothetical protein
LASIVPVLCALLKSVKPGLLFPPASAPASCLKLLVPHKGKNVSCCLPLLHTHPSGRQNMSQDPPTGRFQFHRMVCITDRRGSPRPLPSLGCASSFYYFKPNKQVEKQTNADVFRLSMLSTGTYVGAYSAVFGASRGVDQL